MNLDDLEIFEHVVALGTFSAAARALGRPKSSVSAAVSRLEARLGLRLLERTTRNMRLTEAGARLHHEATHHVQALQDALLSVQSQSRAISGTLRIAAPYEFAAHHLAHVAARLMSAHPDLQIVLDVEHGSVDFFSQNYDIAFSMTDRALADTSVVARRVFSLERGVFAAPDLLGVAARPATPEDLALFPLLCSADEPVWKFQTGASDDWQDLETGQPRLVSPNASVRKQAALEGVGVARITSTFCEAEVAAGQLCRLLPDHSCQPLTVYALMPARRLMLPRVRAFIDTFVQMESAAG